MDTSNKTLANVISQITQQGPNQSQSRSQSFDTYLKVFSSMLSHRFPDAQIDLSNVDYSDVRNIAEFSAACSTVALETWEELRNTNERQQGSTRQQQMRRAL